MKRLRALWRLLGEAREAREAYTSALDHLSDILGTLEGIEHLLTEVRDTMEARQP